MAQRTPRSKAKRKSACRRCSQSLGRAAFYAATTVVVSELVRTLVHLFQQI